MQKLLVTMPSTYDLMGYDKVLVVKSVRALTGWDLKKTIDFVGVNIPQTMLVTEPDMTTIKEHICTLNENGVVAVFMTPEPVGEDNGGYTVLSELREVAATALLQKQYALALDLLQIIMKHASD
jgi:hypothetical protein